MLILYMNKSSGGDQNVKNPLL